MRYLVAVLLLSACCVGQERKDFDSDGSYWREHAEGAKTQYVMGYISAMAFAQMNSGFVCMFVDPKKAEAVNFCVSTAQGFDFNNITVGQLVNGMDTFYKDFRNFPVPLPMAMRLVRDEIKGRTPEDVEKELVGWRQCHADSSKCKAVIDSAAAPAPASTTPAKPQ